MMKTNCNTICVRLSAMVLSAACLAAASWGCVSDERLDAGSRQTEKDMTFRAMKDNGTLASRPTRADILPVTHEEFGETVFYIYEVGTFVDKQKNEYTQRRSVRPYWLASGTDGQLASMSRDKVTGWDSVLDEDDKDENKGENGSYKNDYLPWKLNWFAAETQHLFWSWTWPLGDRDYSTVDNISETTTAEEGVLELPDVDERPRSEAIIFCNSEFPLPDTEEKTKAEADPNSDPDPNPETPDPDPDPDPETPQTTPGNEWKNGEALERLVGTMTDRSYVFNQDGRYVPLTYKHLVSKIILGEFTLVDNTGASQKDLKAKITFYGMPKRAMFYPLPDYKNDERVAPYVTIDHSDPYGLTKGADDITDEEEATKNTGKDGTAFDYNLSHSLTFYILNKSEDDKDNSGGTIVDEENPYANHDAFYICPEVDFNELEYKVEFVEYDKDQNMYVPHSKYGMKGGYFGNFKTVLFERETEGDNGTTNIDTDRVLHAGEVMVLNMTVYQKSGPGTGVWIRNWDNEKLKSATHHNHKGIYSDAEAKTVRDMLNSTDNTTYPSGAREKLVDNYSDEGDVDENGKRIIRQYSDVTIAVSTTDTNVNFRLYYPEYNQDDVILDGMGFTMSFVNTSSASTAGPFKSFCIGNMRDVYITNGESTVYIDPDGRICRINKETGKFEPTGEEWVANSTQISFAATGEYAEKYY